MYGVVHDKAAGLHLLLIGPYHIICAPLLMGFFFYFIIVHWEPHFANKEWPSSLSKRLCPPLPHQLMLCYYVLSRQAEGKKRMKSIGRVEVPQEAFMAVLKLEKEVI